MQNFIARRLVHLIVMSSFILICDGTFTSSLAIHQNEYAHTKPDISQLWFDGGADGQQEIGRLKANAEKRISENERRFAARTGQNSIPLSAPEYADESADDLHLLAQIDLLQASTDKNQYNQWHQNGVERLEKLANLAHSRGVAAQAAQDPSQPHIAELLYRAEIDQTWRDASDGMLKEHIGDAASPEAETFFKKLFWLKFGQVDLNNTRWLKQTIAEYGFPAPSAFGMDAYTAAWTITQHASHAPDFQRDVLRRMKALYSNGEGDGRYIALLEDRLALVAGKPQSFGTQMTCQDGKIRLYDTNDPEDLDERRAAMGLKPLLESTLLGKVC